MSDEDRTAERPDARPFEERLFARLDSIESRLTRLEESAERRAMETRPIWERALAEILAVRKEVERADVRLDRIESAVHDTQSKFHALRADFNELRGAIKEHFPSAVK
jgi:transcriptional antiterminator Rof (Rho-off)